LRSEHDRIRQAVYLAAATYSVVPVVVLWYIWKEPLTAPGFGLGPLTMLYLILTGRWDLVCYQLRLIFLALLLVVTYYRASWLPVVLIAAGLAFLFLLRRASTGEILDLQFPLGGGVYYVAHGGSSSLLNRHSDAASQRFALDIVALGQWGSRAKGIFPESLRAYEIFERPVHSPCSGTVTKVVNDLMDEVPGHMNWQNIAGNHVMIRRDEGPIYVALAHLVKGSVSVRSGERVIPGQLLGRAGNSGNSSEPHLHIHAKRGGSSTSMLDGDAVMMRFGGRWLTRNSIVRSRG
jgi:hypothetical protein